MNKKSKKKGFKSENTLALFYLKMATDKSGNPYYPVAIKAISQLSNFLSFITINSNYQFDDLVVAVAEWLPNVNQKIVIATLDLLN